MVSASACAIAGSTAWAQAKKELIFGVCDAVSYKTNVADTLERFATLQKDIG